MITINANNEKVLTLGYKGEKNVRKIVFDISDLKSAYGEGEASLTNLRVGEYAPYNVTNCKISDDGNSLEWLVNDTDTGKAGKYGSCQLTYTVDNAVAMTKTWQTEVYKSLTPTGKAPEPHYSWLTDLKETAKSIENKITEAEKCIADVNSSIKDIPEQIEHINNSVVSAENSALLAQEAAEAIKNAAVEANQIVTTAEGSSIVLSDSADSPIVEAKIYGKTTGVKNLLDIPDSDETYNGVSVIIENGKVTVVGTSTASQDVYLSGCPTVLEEGVSYTLLAPSILIIQNIMNPDIDSLIGGGSGTFTVQPMYIDMILRLEEGETYGYTFTPKLMKTADIGLGLNHAKNPTVTVQNEDASKTQSISLTGCTLRGIKDFDGNWFARDEIVCDGETVKFIQRVSDDIIEDGTKDYNHPFTSYCTRDIGFNFKRYDTSYVVLFSVASHGITEGITFDDSHSVSNKNVRFSYSGFGVGNYDEFIAFLREENANGTPFTWCAPLETPIETDITDTEAGQALLSLATHYPTTTVICDTDAAITYVADTKNYIDNKFNELAAAIVAQ